MSNDSNRFSRFLQELRRRHVFRTMLAYGAVAFVVLQMGEIILPAFDVGDWALQLVVVASVLGLPVVLALAWVYEITPAGIRTMREVDEETGHRLVTEGSLLPRITLLAVTLLATSAAGMYWLRMSVAPEGDGAGAPGAIGPAFLAGQADAADVPIRSLAVLPLESFVASSAEAAGTDGDFFALGMHEALTSRLSQDATSFRVISRTTVQGYEAEGRSMAQVGQDLGVEGVIEGSIFSDGERVRITVQLIHAPSDTHIWAGDYEREMENLIALQTEVATAISDAILGQLQGGDAAPTRLALDTEAPIPPDSMGPEVVSPEQSVVSVDLFPVSPEATHAQMRGRVALFRDDPAALEEALRHFEVAIQEDSSLASAWAAFAGTKLMMEAEDMSSDALDEVSSAAAMALALDPGSREALDVMSVVDGIRFERGGSVSESEVQVETEASRIEDVSEVEQNSDGARGLRPASSEFGARIQAMTLGSMEEGSVEAQLTAARSLLAFGRRGQAEELLVRVVEENPDHADGWIELERVLVLQEDLDGVVELRQTRAEQVGDEVLFDGRTVDDFGEAVSREGLQGYWEWRLDELVASESETPSVALATALAATGSSDEALDMLLQLSAAGDQSIITTRGDPVWDALRRDPRFREAVRPFGRPPSGGRGGRGRDGGRS